MDSGPLYPRNRAWHPPAYTPGYKTSMTRAPSRPLVALGSTLSEETGPVFGRDMLGARDNDLVLNFTGEPAIGERIIVHGKVLDENANAVPGVLVEIWQANAGGRYRHRNDGYLAPLDPNFGGCGRAITDVEGRYAFRTVKPGAYPWRNGGNDWRPAHIHVSVFGHSFAQRLVTQMYFEGDPLIARCPIVQGIPSQDAIERLTAALDLNATIPLDSVAWHFDVVLRGRRRTIFEEGA
jgi:protocatechuate 3,4-dioxygenase beta subunit